MLAPRRNVLLLAVAAACWGLGAVISKRAVDEIPPFTLLPIQLGTSLVVFSILMRSRGLPLRDPRASPWLARLGLLNPGLAYALSLLGLVHITVSLSVMLWAFEPVMILALAAWLLRERISPRLVALTPVAIGGLLLVLYEPGTSGDLFGAVLGLAGIGCCAAYTIATRRWLAGADSTAQVVLAQEAYALAFALVLLALDALFGGMAPLGAVTPDAWISAIVSGVLYYGLAYWFYLSALRGTPASTAAVSFYLIPIFGVAGGFVLLGERLGPGQWVGVVVVLAALLGIFRQTLGSPESGQRDDRPTANAW